MFLANLLQTANEMKFNYVPLDQLKKIKKTKSRLKRNTKMLQNKNKKKILKQNKRMLKVKNFTKNTPSKLYHIQKNAKS